MDLMAVDSYGFYIEDCFLRQIRGEERPVKSFAKQEGLIQSVQCLISRYYTGSHVDVHRVAPTQVKTFLGVQSARKGERKKDKSDVVEAVRELLRDPGFLEERPKYYREAVCDAVAVALAGDLLFSE